MAIVWHFVYLFGKAGVFCFNRLLPCLLCCLYGLSMAKLVAFPHRFWQKKRVATWYIYATSLATYNNHTAVSGRIYPAGIPYRGRWPPLLVTCTYIVTAVGERITEIPDFWLWSINKSNRKKNRRNENLELFIPHRGASGNEWRPGLSEHAWNVSQITMRNISYEEPVDI